MEFFAILLACLVSLALGVAARSRLPNVTRMTKR